MPGATMIRENLMQWLTHMFPNHYQAREVLTSMKADAAGGDAKVEGEFLLKVDGGATVNNLLMQLQVCYILVCITLQHALRLCHIFLYKIFL
jgi:glycerol kinase